MGNWRTVQIIGEVKDKNEVDSIIKYLTVGDDYESPASEDDIFYLQFGEGLCGLNQWVKNNGKINIVGNVYERDCEIEDLEKELKILADKFKSLDIILHTGGEYESLDCIASFEVHNGMVERKEPLIKGLDEFDKDRMQMNLMKALGIKF